MEADKKKDQTPPTEGIERVGFYTAIANSVKERLEQLRRKEEAKKLESISPVNELDLELKDLLVDLVSLSNKIERIREIACKIEDLRKANNENPES